MWYSRRKQWIKNLQKWGSKRFCQWSPFGKYILAMTDKPRAIIYLVKNGRGSLYWSSWGCSRFWWLWFWLIWGCLDIWKPIPFHASGFEHSFPTLLMAIQPMSSMFLGWLVPSVPIICPLNPPLKNQSGWIKTKTTQSRAWNFTSPKKNVISG